MQLSLLLLTPLRRRSGNFSTISRIKSYLENHGHHCEMADPQSFSDIIDFQNYLQFKAVDVVIGIHAYRSGRLLRASPVPYILILGGTDVNEFYVDIDKLSIMTEAVANARYVVVFGKSLATSASLLWPDLLKNKMEEIKQAVISHPSKFCLLKYLKTHMHIPSSVESLHDVKVFLFVGGIRPVKDPVFLIETFTEWHKKDATVYYVIIGPKTDADYFEDVFHPAIKQSSGVIYIPSLPIEDTHAAMRDSFCLVNSSNSEGMSLAILEAMSLRLPVMARNVKGNKDIITDGENGLLFETSQDFLHKARILTSSPATRDQLITNASDKVKDSHSVDSEGQAYWILVKSTISRN